MYVVMGLEGLTPTKYLVREYFQCAYIVKILWIKDHIIINEVDINMFDSKLVRWYLNFYIQFVY